MQGEAGRVAGAASLLRVRELHPNGILSTEEAPAERLAALELRLREQVEAAELCGTELRAMERDLAVKDSFIRRLERGQELLSVELAQVRARADELFGDLERAEARCAAAEAALAASAAELASVRASTSLRVGATAVAVARRLGPLGRLARHLASGRPAGR